MSTSTLAPEARRNAALFMTGDLTSCKPKMYRRFAKNDSDEEAREILVIEDLPVFRSGVFRDSMGYQHTWEAEHLSQMVDNFDILNSRKIFSEVPVRDGHPGWIMSGTEGTGKVVGWHTGLRIEERKNPSDGGSYTYLLANVEIIAPYAIEAIESTLWRNRSAEVGAYITNAEAEYWPVFQGFAFCDIPAVEGLNGFSKQPGVGSAFSIMSENEKEIPVATGKSKAHSGGNGVGEDQATETSTPNEGEENTSSEEEQTDPPEGAATEPPPTGGQPTTSGEGQHSSNSNPAVGSFTFTVNGKPLSDFGQVQSHITALEAADKSRREQFRKDYVAGLAHDSKILAPQVGDMEAFALSLNDEQWSQFTKTWDAAPASSLTANHAGGTSNHAGNVTAEGDNAEIENLKGIIAHHKSAGMPQDKIEATPSFKRLQLLTKEN